MPWKNGLGTTRELAASHPAGDKFCWRISVADVTANGPFSEFAGYTRVLLLLEGAGIDLATDDGVVRLRAPFELAEFSGDDATDGTLVDGRIRDLNVIAERATVRCFVHVWRPSIEGPVRASSPGGLPSFAICVRGTVRAVELDATLGVLDAVRVDGPAAVTLTTNDDEAVLCVVDFVRV